MVFDNPWVGWLYFNTTAWLNLVTDHVQTSMITVYHLPTGHQPCHKAKIISYGFLKLEKSSLYSIIATDLT